MSTIQELPSTSSSQLTLLLSQYSSSSNSFGRHNAQNDDKNNGKNEIDHFGFQKFPQNSTHNVTNQNSTINATGSSSLQDHDVALLDSIGHTITKIFLEHIQYVIKKDEIEEEIRLKKLLSDFQIEKMGSKSTPKGAKFSKSTPKLTHSDKELNPLDGEPLVVSLVQPACIYCTFEQFFHAVLSKYNLWQYASEPQHHPSPSLSNKASFNQCNHSYYGFSCQDGGVVGKLQRDEGTNLKTHILNFGINHTTHSSHRAKPINDSIPNDSSNDLEQDELNLPFLPQIKAPLIFLGTTFHSPFSHQANNITNVISMLLNTAITTSMVLPTIHYNPIVNEVCFECRFDQNDDQKNNDQKNNIQSCSEKCQRNKNKKSPTN